MDPKRGIIVREFRLQLESGNFFIGSVNDNEVATWLFRAGPKRIQLLQWCLGRLDSSLLDGFQGCDETIAEKRTIAHLKALGLSQNTDAILGTAADEEQLALWRRMLVLLSARKHLHSSNTKDNSKKLSTGGVVSSLNQSKDFKDLLNVKVELLPPELLLAPTSLAKKNVAEELKNVLLKLEELQENTGNLSIDADSENYGNQSLHTTEEYKESFHENFRRIQEYYNHLVQTVFPAVQRKPTDPVAEALGSYVENVADHVISFVQMLQAKEDIHKMASELKTSESSHKPESLEVSEMQQAISKCHSLVVEILSFWRVHKML